MRRLYDDLTAAGFDVWFDRESMPSRALTFLQEIRDAIAARDRLVLVVGPDALASEYVTAEWRWALDFGIPINPVLRLGDYDALPDELKLLDAPDFRDDTHYRERFATLARQLSEPVPPMGKLVGVPSLPQHLLKRADRLRALKDAVLADVRRTAVVTGEPARVGVHGMGGIGKSVLATMLARDTEVRRTFPDGVIWVPIGQTPNLPELQRAVARALDDPGLFDNTGEGKAKLQELLTDRAVLLLLDDLWDAHHADAFDCLGPRCRMAITSRDAGIITALGGTEHQVQLLTDAEARSLLAEWAAIETAALPQQAEAILTHCGRLPLALSLCGALVRDGESWDDLLEALAEADLEYLDHPHGSILRSIKVSVDRLAPDEAARLAELRVFPPDATVPEAAVATLWAHTGDLSERHARKLLTRLGTKALVQLDGASPNRQVSLHDLIHDYVGDLVPDEPALHGKLLEAYRTNCPEGWASGPNDGYFLQHLRDHLVAAGRGEELPGLCLGLHWLEAKAEAGLVFDLPNDLVAAQNALPLGDPWRRNLRLLEQALRGDLHFIARHPTTLFQCLWNSAWWYDCRGAAEHYDPPEGGWGSTVPPWEREEPKLCTLLDRWRAEKGARQPGLAWLRSLRPPPFPLGGAELTCLRGHEESVTSVALDPDGRRVISGSYDNTVRLWDAHSGQELASLQGHSGWVTSVAFSPDGRRVVSGSHDKTVRLWDTGSGQESACLRGHESEVNSVAFSPDRRRVVSGSSDHTVRLWDVGSGQESACLRGHESEVNSVAFSPDGRRVVSGSSDHTVRLWDADSGQELACLRGHERKVTGVAFSPDGRRVASGSWDKTVRIWDADSGQQLACLQGHGQEVNSVAFSPDGRRVVSGSWDQTVRIWDADSGQQLACLQGHYDWVKSVAFSPDGRRVVSGSYDKTVRLWDADSRQQLACLQGHEGGVTSVSFSPDGSRVVSGSYDRTARLWGADSGQQLACLQGHQDRVRSVAFSPDGRRVVSGSVDRTIRLWDADSGQQLTCLQGHGNSVWSVAFSPDGRGVASGSDDRTVRLWDANSEQELTCLQGHDYWVNNVAFSHDGNRVVSGAGDNTVRIWDADNGRELACLRGHESEVISVTFSPDGRRVASGSWDHTMRIWDVESRECLEVIEGSGDVHAIAAGPEAFPWRALSHNLETVVRRAGSGEGVAWWPISLSQIATHPSGRIWAGASAAYVALIALEGNPDR